MNMLPIKNATELSALTHYLIRQGVIDKATALQAKQTAEERHVSLISYLIQSKIVSANIIALAAANEFGIPLIDLNAIDKELIPRGLVTEKLVHQHLALPLFQRGNKLYVAITDPMNTTALNEFRFHTGLKTQPILVEEDKLTQLIDELMTQEEQNDLFSELTDTDLDTIDITSETANEEKQELNTFNDAPIVRFVHKILLDAIKKGVSDIHFEPYEKVYRIRFRKDGILYETANPPVNLIQKITARIKVMSRLDISEHRIPQDGHFNMALSKKNAINFRVSTCPTMYGEKVVIRILDPSKVHLGIHDLGYEPAQETLFLETIDRPQGMLLVTGPTGSGKTVSLYTALSILNTAERNISTIEDPVEIQIPGINQVSINPKAGFDFSMALRAFLRQDPDVIMLGEIRDFETADIAIKAAQTGHFVLSTLHTNSAPETLTRLINMGIPTYNIATSVSLIIAQRLIRCLCPHCKIPTTIPSQALYEEGFYDSDMVDLHLFIPDVNGCEHCKNGYNGRIGIYEMLPVTPEIGRIIMAGGHALEIQAKAIEEGMQTLRRAGLLKAKQGISSLEEVNRATEEN